jgi:hypothetical protein
MNKSKTKEMNTKFLKNTEGETRWNINRNETTKGEVRIPRFNTLTKEKKTAIVWSIQLNSHRYSLAIIHSNAILPFNWNNISHVISIIQGILLKSGNSLLDITSPF